MFKISYESQTSGSQSLSLSPMFLFYKYIEIGIDQCGQPGPFVKTSPHPISLGKIKFIFLKRRKELAN